MGFFAQGTQKPWLSASRAHAEQAKESRFNPPESPFSPRGKITGKINPWRADASLNWQD